MPGTVDDFINRFSGPQTMDDSEASHFVDRFASEHPNDREFDNQAFHVGASEYLGKLPDAQFERAAQTAYASATPPQQQGLASTLMRALQGRGVDISNLGGIFGGRSSGQMTPDQYSQMANMARQQHPEAMQEVVRQQPWLVKAMGNPILMGALGMVASRMIRNRTRPPGV